MNGNPDPAVDADMVVTFKGRKLSDVSGGTFPAPFLDNHFTNNLMLPFDNARDWNSFSSVTVK